MKGSDFYEMADGELATARSWTLQTSSSFIEASHTTNTFIFLDSSLPKVNKFQPSPVILVYNLRLMAVTFMLRMQES